MSFFSVTMLCMSNICDLLVCVLCLCHGCVFETSSEIRHDWQHFFVKCMSENFQSCRNVQKLIWLCRLFPQHLLARADVTTGTATSFICSLTATNVAVKWIETYFTMITMADLKVVKLKKRVDLTSDWGTKKKSSYIQLAWFYLMQQLS